MMKCALLVTVGLMGLFLFGCIEKAAPEEIDQMCKKLVELRAEVDVTPADQRIAAVEKDFAERIAKVEASKEAALKALDEELAGKVAALTKDEEKTQLTESYTGMKNTRTTEAATQVQKLNDEKGESVARVKEEAAAAETAVKEAIDKCKAEAQKDVPSKKMAQCRIAADTVDTYWNKCR